MTQQDYLIAELQEENTSLKSLNSELMATRSVLSGELNLQKEKCKDLLFEADSLRQANSNLKNNYKEIQISAFNLLNLLRVHSIQKYINDNPLIKTMSIDFCCILASQKDDLKAHLVESVGVEKANLMLGMWTKFFAYYAELSTQIKRKPTLHETKLPQDSNA